MTVDRRDFLRTGVTATALAMTPRWLHALKGPEARAAAEAPPITDPAVRQLALRAVDAARAAGATYADVRMTYSRRENSLNGADTGVRALVNGYWGFAASRLWTPDEMARLGREAVHQAQVSAIGKPRVVELGQIPVVKDGHWTMPVERDPFDVPAAEIQDFWWSLQEIYRKRLQTSTRIITDVAIRPFFQRQDKAFASTEGSYCTQRLYRTLLNYPLGYPLHVAGRWTTTPSAKLHKLSSPLLMGASRGWEYIQQAPLREEVDRLVEEMEEDLALPWKPLEVGRYDVVFDAWSMATLLDGTLGCATELDRALGYEANAGGTSYLNDPFGMLGRYEAGTPLLTVTAERSAPGGLATVKWDDEGVAPDPFTLVKDGVLVDFQTHREAAGWFPGGGRRSHGCAAAPRAFDAPLIHPPNLTLAAGREALDFDGLVGQLKKGLAVKRLTRDRLYMDFQCLNGLSKDIQAYEVKDGKRVARIRTAFLFRAPEVWTGLLALGGPASQRSFAFSRTKGEPAQTTWYTLSAVPALVKQVTAIRPLGPLGDQ